MRLPGEVIPSPFLIRLTHTDRKGSLPSCTTDSGARLDRPQMQREIADAQNQRKRKVLRQQPPGVPAGVPERAIGMPESGSGSLLRGSATLLSP
jgi:hypothetical protein